MVRYFRIRWWVKPSGEPRITGTDTYSTEDELDEEKANEVLNRLADPFYEGGCSTKFEDATLAGCAIENWGMIKLTKLKHPPKDENDVVDADLILEMKPR